MKRQSPVLVLAVGLAVAMAGCSDPSPTSDTNASGTSSTAGSNPSGSAEGAVPSAAVDKDAQAALPAALKSKGTLVVTMSQSSPPLHYVDQASGKTAGLDVDMGEALGQALGLKVEIKGGQFDAIIPGLQAGKFDIAVSQMSPTAKRAQVLDFVDYFQSGSAIGVPQGNPKKVTADLCGKKVGTLKGSTQDLKRVPEANDACVKAGKPKIENMTYPDMQAPALAMQSGRLDAIWVDGPTLAYAIKQGAKMDILAMRNLSPVSIGFKKGAGLQDALQKALKSLKSNGVYAAILTKWGQDAGAIDDFAFNKVQ